MNTKISTLFAIVAALGYSSVDAWDQWAPSSTTSSSYAPGPTNGPGFLPKGTKFTLMSPRTGKFCSDTDGGFMCTREKVGPWETFTAGDSWGNNFVFSGGRHNGICYDTGRGTACDGKDNSKPYQVQYLGNDRIALRGVAPNYKVCSILDTKEGGGMMCDKDQIYGDAEQLIIRAP